ncbi:MAG: o-succinylbenzoate synthase, partial [Chloroflexi bacterium]|nr:o-succinylbenzoate synthase [Chloroflexota bacterium]
MSHTLRSVELYLVRLPLVRPFTTSSHTKDHLEHILLRARDEDGREGWGECASASDPYYCSETSETSWHILRDFLIPGLLGCAWEHPDEAAATWRIVRGNRFAKAGLEMACWDLFCRARGEPLAAPLGGTRQEIHSGVSLGIEPTPDAIVEQVANYLDQGYKRIKMKIGPGRDIAFVSAVRERWPDVLLMADANSAYSLDNAEHVAAL